MLTLTPVTYFYETNLGALVQQLLQRIAQPLLYLGLRQRVIEYRQPPVLLDRSKLARASLCLARPVGAAQGREGKEKFCTLMLTKIKANGIAKLDALYETLLLACLFAGRSTRTRWLSPR
ncbi:hypothetical protein [Nostoc sp.]|uniref:hypothetical protein n=1 Tax=Nostoc sp. TaxID=1180 RepID=UPI002FFD00FE